MGEGVDYDMGIQLGSDLVGTPFVNSSFSIDSGGVSLDLHDGISIGCVAAGVSFGDGIFMPVPEPSSISLQTAGFGTVIAILAGRTRRRTRLSGV